MVSVRSVTDSRMVSLGHISLSPGSSGGDEQRLSPYIVLVAVATSLLRAGSGVSCPLFIPRASVVPRLFTVVDLCKQFSLLLLVR